MARRKNTGWVPDQHGAWVMVIVPILLGIIITGPQLLDIPLAVAWFAGYFAFFALGLWLKVPAKRKRTFVPALATYAAISAMASLIVIVGAPRVLWAACWFAPLVAVAVYEAYRKRPRSVASGMSTTLASAALIPTCGLLLPPGTADWRALLVACAVVALYQCGTILFVKTMIRNRGDRRWLAWSIGYHVLAAGAVIGLWLGGYCRIWPALVMVAVAVRSWLMPYLNEGRPKPMSPKLVGMVEGIWVLAVLDSIIAGI
ncbi:YwiC-like family protein [Corynebacterium sp. 13CS0277]|uniref:YwiC-like family protein n=1 Tax=Corynebacterium sp. 13CS0277 TaxID=2071994 RepID=UPI001304E8C1|nr:YwiC-like family protein [Corynebacterium sp. 13CS0277]